MIVYRRPVRFQEIDAAGIVFFGRYLDYAHEAMEHFFAELEGGYRRLILERRVGLPAVDVKMSFAAPLHFGQTLLVETTTRRLGRRSAVLGYLFVREGDSVVVAEVEHTVVTTDLDGLRSCEMPHDVRLLLTAHQSSPETST
jgi:4-hydroxybenzoyl-CoA thioesterase